MVLLYVDDLQIFFNSRKKVEEVKEKVEEGIIKLVYMPTCLQTADILTKALSRTNFEKLRFKLGMIDIYNPA